MRDGSPDAVPGPREATGVRYVKIRGWPDALWMVTSRGGERDKWTLISRVGSVGHARLREFAEVATP